MSIEQGGYIPPETTTEFSEQEMPTVILRGLTKEELLAESAAKPFGNIIERVPERFREAARRALEIRNHAQDLHAAKNFDELDAVLRQLSGIQGTQKTYEIPELCSLIDAIRSGSKSIEYLTRTEGLRGKVEELMAKGVLERFPIGPDSDALPLPETDWEKIQAGISPDRAYSKAERHSPALRSIGFRTHYGAINGPMIWFDGIRAIFDTPQGKLVVSAEALLGPDGLSLEDHRKAKETEEGDQRRRRQQQQSRQMQL